MIEHLTSPTAQAISVTLLHFLWQGAVIALVYWGLQTAIGLKSARVRYVSSLATLVVLAVCPIVTFAVLADTNYSTNPELAYVNQEGIATVDSHQMVARDLYTVSMQDAFENSESSQATRNKWNLHAFLTATQPYVLLIWLAGVMLSGARLTAGAFNIVWLRSGRMPIPAKLSRRSLELAKRIGLKTARVYSSTRIREAAVVGFWNPVVLLPASWLMALPVDVLEAVIAHELAHIRRFDVWVNLLQRVVETMLFYHPAVWWLSNQIRLEREMCCDEIAVSVTEQRENYAIALERVARIQSQGGLNLAPAFLGEKRMNLLSRVRNVLGQSNPPERSPACLVGIMVLTVPLMLFSFSGISSIGNEAVAQEGGKSAEAEAGPRKSAEGKAGARKSAEQVGEGALEGFKPESKREAALFQMIQQLQREVSALRREVRSRGTGESTRDGDDILNTNRDGDLNQSDRTEASKTLPIRWERSKVGRVFKAYDKNGDKFVSLEEWLAMTNGNISDSRRKIQTRRFQAAGIGDDEKMSPAEFSHYYTVGRYKNTRDGEGKKRGPRDGEGNKKGPRDGEGVKKGPRDGEGKVKPGPKDEG
ncbi:MAG: M48 family metalloprotease [Planctomycetes bacterium]|nr:M48 family metalloprotease [Planctomycetota bacterium]MCH9727752.1 M48 family metalloprotease [Planctomycetota bacterium]MCH9776923.1 M48 family metalloprotease [Planctomycetota bacterium]MCH9790085.1 M48 family metalloprotease [Planctomycetota bacterium]